MNFTNASSSENITTGTSNIIISLFIVIFLVVGVAGSTLTMAVIFINKHLHTAPNLFIFSLCISDLISAVVCSPLWLYRRTWGFQHWHWGSFWCKFYWTSDFTTSYVTSLHIFSFAGLRLIAIKRPFLIAKISRPITLIYIVCLWLVALIAALPLVDFMGVDDYRDDEPFGSSWPACSILDVTDVDCCVQQYNIYMAITSPLFFYAPDIFVIVFSVMIAKTLVQRRKWMKQYHSPTPKRSLRGQSNPAIATVCENLPDIVIDANSSVQANERQMNSSEPCEIPMPELATSPVRTPPAAVRQQNCSSSDVMHYQNLRRVVVQLTLITFAFMVGYIPQTVYLLWTTVTPKQDIYATDYWFGVSTYLCLRFSECLNPIFYNLGSCNLRMASKKLLRRIFCREKARTVMTNHRPRAATVGTQL